MQRRNGLKLVALLLVVIVGSVFATTAPALAVETGDASISITRTITASVQNYSKIITPPKSANKDGVAAEISIKFPKLISTAGKNGAVDAINNAILEGLRAFSGTAAAGQSVEQMQAAFGKEYEESMTGNPDSIGGWLLKFEATIRHVDEDLVSLEILDSIFKGEAHPTSHITYRVFSLKTGQPVDLSAFVPEEKIPDLTKVAEKRFRNVRRLKPDETFEEAGFWFDNNQFRLNRNFLVSKEGLAFSFNPYEVAPYALGATEMVIPWEELKGVTDPNGLAGRFH